LQAVYLQTLQRAAEVAGGNGGWLEHEILKDYDQIHQAALDDPVKQCYPPEGQALANCTNEQFESDIAFLIRFANARSADVLQQLNAVLIGL
jgi:hypothetical protein